MEKFTLSQLDLADLKRVVNLKESGIRAYDWTIVDGIELTDREQQRLAEFEQILESDPVH